MLSSGEEIVVEPDGKIDMLDTGRLIRIDPVTGGQSLVTPTNSLNNGADLLIGDDGNLIISDPATKEIFADAVQRELTP